MRRSKAEIVFAALTIGIVVEQEDYRYVIRDGNFGILGRKGVRWEVGEDVFLGLDWPISTFIQWADKFSDEEVAGIAGTITLNQLQRKR